MISIWFTIYIVATAACATVNCHADGVINGTERHRVRIVGGEDTLIENYPYQVFMSSGCGGVLISSNVVLTAAHCCNPKDQHMKIRAGSTNRNNGGQIRVVRRQIIHPYYNRQTLDSDISILILDRPFQLSSSVKPIQLPRENENPPVGTVGIATGWGHVDNWSKNTPLKLRQVKLAVMDQNTCRYRRRPYPVTKNQLCGGVRNSAKSICQGDSGGPFAINGVLHGISSSNSGRQNCGNRDIPSVFTRVSAFRSWIRQMVNI